MRRLGETVVLGEVDFPWEFERPYGITLEVSGAQITGRVEENEIVRITDTAELLSGGGFAFVCEEGLITSNWITIKPNLADLSGIWPIPDQ